MKIAIIGSGSISGNHADAILHNKDLELAAVCDTNPAQLEKYAGTKAALYTDYRAMLKQGGFESVHICTPHYLHADMAVDSLEAGYHVLTEKPMAMYACDTRRMTAAAAKTGKKLGVCFQNRYNNTSVKMKEYIDSGAAGKILGGRAFVTWHREDSPYYKESGWRGNWSTEGGGVLINQSIHTLDLLQWLMGGVKTVKGTVATHMHDIEVEDAAEAVLVTGSGAPAVFYATTSYAADSPVFLEILCEEATLTLNGDLIIRKKSGGVITESDAAPSAGKGYWGSGHGRLINDFYRCIAESIPFPVDGEAGAVTIDVLDELYKQYREGCGCAEISI